MELEFLAKQSLKLDKIHKCNEKIQEIILDKQSTSSKETPITETKFQNSKKRPSTHKRIIKTFTNTQNEDMISKTRQIRSFKSATKLIRSIKPDFRRRIVTVDIRNKGKKREKMPFLKCILIQTSLKTMMVWLTTKTLINLKSCPNTRTCKG